MKDLTKEERSLLLYLETRAVDYGGSVFLATIRNMVDGGWRFEWDLRTGFIGACHPLGGKQTICEIHGNSYIDKDRLGLGITTMLNAMGTQNQQQSNLPTGATEHSLAPSAGSANLWDGDEDLLQNSLEVIRTTGCASTSVLQRRLRIGYVRACGIMVELERRKIVGPANPANGYKREILQNDRSERP
jgi:hypothetical protein